MPLAPNHLVVLDVLLDTHSVSETARRLSLSQSAISHTLRGLREHYEDELLVRVGDRMLPTPLAESLRQPLAAALRQLGDVAATRQKFDPQSIERTYVVAMRDQFIDLFVPKLANALAVNAPKASLRVIQWDANTIETQLGSGAADLGIGVDPPNSAQVIQRKLFEEGFVCVAKKGVIKRKLTMRDYANLQHVVVTRTDAMSSPVDGLLAEAGLVRHVIIRTPYFASAFAIVAEGKMVITAPERIARRAVTQGDLEIVPLPFDVPKFAVHVVWHERFAASPLNQWFREQLGLN